MYIIYGKSNCPFCDKAKELLTKKSLRYIYIDLGLEENSGHLQYVKEDLGFRTVPVIKKDGNLIGGYDDLVKRLM